MVRILACLSALLVLLLPAGGLSAAEPQVASGMDHTLMLDTDGTVWAWGNNANGQLGDGTATNRDVPTQVQASGGANLANIIKVAAGTRYSLALRSDGTVWAWGKGVNGVLGNQTTTDQLQAVPVTINDGSALTGVTAIAAGHFASLALKADGTVWAWGDDLYGQLGDDNSDSGLVSYAVPVKALDQCIAISAGAWTSYAVRADGTAWAWGWGANGERGDGTTTSVTYVRGQVLASAGTPMTNVVAIAGGAYFALIQVIDGSAYSFGLNDFGQLGLGDTASRSYPTYISGLGNVVRQLSAGSYQLDPASGAERYGYGSSALCISRFGDVFAWGRNDEGQLGLGHTNDQLTPTYQTLLKHRQVAIGGRQGAWLSAIGEVRLAGDNSDGQLGAGVSGGQSSALVLADARWSLAGMAQTVGGTYFHLGLKGDGTVWAWGNNSYGQLGNGTYSDSSTPVQVVDAAGNPLSGVIAIACGGYHGLALTAEGMVLGWGSNASGQLGNGTTGGSSSVAGLLLYKSGSSYVVSTGMTDISGLANGSVALYYGYVVGWGGVNCYMFPSDGTAESKSLPFMGFLKASASNYLWPARQIDGGYWHGGAVMADGSTRMWGFNGLGSHGAGDTVSPDYASNVTDLGSGLFCRQIAAGQYHTAFLTADGKVAVSGSDNLSQLGDNATGASYQTKPVATVGLSEVKAISSGTDYADCTFALGADGRVSGWGRNLVGTEGYILGVGDTTSTSIDLATDVQVKSRLFVLSLRASAIAAGDYGGSAVTPDGQLRCWGEAGSGRIGNGDSATDHEYAVLTTATWLPTIELGVVDDSASESGDQASMLLTRSGTTVASTYVNLGRSGTAGSGDYGLSENPVRIARGDASAQVYIQPIDDPVEESAESVVLVVGTSSSARPGNVPSGAATILDDDHAGILADAATGPTTESAGQATFQVRLASRPTSPVTVAIASNNIQEGVVDTSALVFTAADWNVPQTVTVTGVPDQVDDGDQPYTIKVGPATSSDPFYQGLSGVEVPIANLDIDSSGIQVSAISDPTDENGSSGKFTVVLTSKPVGIVTLPLISSRSDEVAVNPTTITFDPSTWDIPQLVICTGLADQVDDGDQTVHITAGPATGDDPTYLGLTATTPDFLNIDEDTAGITVQADNGGTVSEGGAGDVLRIRLDTRPLAPVTVTVSHAGGEVLVGLSPADISATTQNLVFTAANWSVPQAVWVAAVDDPLVDGNQSTLVDVAASSADPVYDPLSVPQAFLTIDNDAAGIVLSKGLLVTSESLSSAAVADSVVVALTAKPTAEVQITLHIPTVSPASSPNDESGENLYEGSFDPTVDPGTTGLYSTTITIQPEQWQTGVAVTVYGRRGSIGIQDGDRGYDLSADPSVSTDGTFTGLATPLLSVTNYDVDVPGVTITQSGGSTQVVEGGVTDSYLVVLNTAPASASDTVIVYPQLPASARFTLSPTFLVFTGSGPKAWNLAQTVTVTAIDDQVAQGNEVQALSHLSDVSADPGYSEQVFATVNVSVVDNDSSGIVVAPTAGLTTSEGGTSANFTVVLTSQPTAPVMVPVVPLTSALGFEGEIASGGAFTTATLGLTFSASNWFTPQTVTVRGRNDVFDDGDQPYTVRVANPTSGPANYTAIDPPDVSLINQDNDSAGFTVSPLSGLVTSEAGGTATCSVVLASRPSVAVVLPISSSRSGEILVRPLGSGSFTASTSLTFAPAAWNVPQVIELQGQADGQVADGNQTVVIQLAADSRSTADSVYRNLDPPDVQAVNTDLDSAGITVGAASGPTSEAGGSATVALVLTSRPTADVSIPLSVSNVSEGSLDRSQVSFTPATWNVPQVVTITGVADGIDDGAQAYQLVTGLAISSDPSYNGRASADVTLSNSNIDSAGVVIADGTAPAPTIEGGRYVTTEGGLTAAFTVVLTAKPIAAITLTTAAMAPLEGSVSPAALTFSPVTWNVPQEVVVTGLGLGASESAVDYLLSFGAAQGGDPAYAGRFAQTRPLRNKPVNNQPVIDALADRTVDEADGGAAAQTVALSGIGSGAAREAQTLVLTAVSDNPALIPDPVVNYTSGAATGSLAFSPVADRSGSARITVTVSDDGGTALGGLDTTTRLFTITVRPRNDAPMFSASGAVTAIEDSGPQTTPWASAISPGPVDEAGQALAFQVAVSDPALFSVQPTIAVDGTLSFTPAVDAFGSATVSASLRDNGGTDNGGSDASATVAFLLTILPRNDAPSFTPGPVVSVVEDAPAQAIPWASGMGTGPTNEAAQTVAFQVTGATPGRYAVAPAIAADGTLTFTPAADAFGTDLLSVTLVDDGGSANGGTPSSGSVTLSLTIRPVNDAPVFTAGGAVTVAEDAGPQLVPGWASAIDPGPGEGGQVVGFTVTVDDPTLFQAAPAISASGVLSFTPATNANGSTTVSVVLQDNGGIADGGNDRSLTTAFLLTVQPVNDQPTFNPGPAVVVAEDSGPQAIPWASGLVAGPANESAQAMAFTVTGATAARYTVAPAIASDGTLTFTPAPDAVGTDLLQVVLVDDGGTTNGGIAASGAVTLSLTIQGVNDAPSFTAGAGPVVLEDAGSQTIAAWATGISAGPASESAQALTFLLTPADPDWFAVAPAIASDGTLTFTPAPNEAESTTVSIILVDSGGTAGGGIDRSAAVVVQFTATPVNDRPFFTSGGVVSVAEDSGTQVVPWATAIAMGPVNESTQTATFTLTGATASRYAVQPTINTEGVLSFRPAPDASGSDTIAVVLTDNGGTAVGGIDTSLVHTLVLTITAVNDQPQITANVGQTVLVGGTASLTTAALDAVDVETPADSLVFRLQLPPSGGDLLLDGVALGTNGTATRGAIAAGRLTYRHRGGPGTSDGFAFRFEDGNGGASDPQVYLITLDRRVPIVVLAGTAPLFAENQPTPVLVADAATVEDGDSPTFAGGQIRVTVVGGGSGTVLDLRNQGTGSGQVSVSAGTVRVDGLDLGAISGGTLGAPLVIDCTANMTPAMAQLVLRNLQFWTPSDDPGVSATVTVAITDDHANSSAPTTTTVTIQAVDDPPVASAALVTVPADGWAAGAVTVADPDSTIISYTIATIPAKGTVTAVALDGTFIYQALPGRSGDDAFDIQVSDGSSTVAVTVPVRITGAGTGARPWFTSDPPMEAVPGDVLRAGILVSFTPPPGGTVNLTFQLRGAPTGMTLTTTGPDSAQLVWPVPVGTVGHVAFEVVVVETVSGTTATLPVLLLVQPLPSGSN